MFQPTSYRPSAAVPRSRPATRKSALEYTYHASRPTRMCLLKVMAWPRRDSLAHAMTFSRHILVGRLAWYVYSNADFLVAGRLLGTAALGLYEVGWRSEGRRV